MSRPIVAAAVTLLERRRRLVLAVSGGVDSMVLLDAVARHRRRHHHVVVAILDHATGEHATEACAVAAAVAATHRLPIVTERLTPGASTEAAWRAVRWSFLRWIAERESAVVVAGHTRDDQVETVVMRLLRGASPRGLAGLYASSPVERPLLGVSRAEIIRYATRHGVRYVEDPSNLSVSHLRNRVRLNILPAIRAVRPEFEAGLLELSRHAATWRSEVEDVASRFVVAGSGRDLVVDTDRLRELGPAERRVIWPALAAQAGVTLDRRGLDRLAGMVESPVGTRAQVSGRVEAVMGRQGLTVRRRVEREHGVRPLEHGTQIGGFRFSASAPSADGSNDPWRIRFRLGAKPIVREWVAGDRLTYDLSGSKRRVKRYFADAGIPGPLREGWPVVLDGPDIVWIPGIQSNRSIAPENGDSIEYRCERIAD